MNSAPASVQTTVYLAPDTSLVADGYVLINSSNGYFPFERAGGRWSVGPGDNGGTMVQIQIFPAGRPIFSLFVIPRDSKHMNNFFAPAAVETSCERIG